jgi:integrase
MVDTDHHLRDGEIVLYKRERSSQWQARIKTPEGKWRRLSTKTDDLPKASKTAEEEHDLMRMRVKMGLPADARRKMSSAIDIYEERLKAEVEAGTGKAIYPSYLQIIKNWIRPFFASKVIGEIDDAVMEEFDTWRKKKLKGEPAKSTINNHHVVLRAVFDTAAKKKWMKKGDIPDLTIKDKGRKGKRRPDFTNDEIQDLMKYMAGWINEKSPNRTTRYKRKLLLYYVSTLVLTGMRPGTEIENLRWKDIGKFRTREGEEAYKVFVNRGKTGEREVVAHHGMKQIVDGLKQLTRPQSQDELLFVMQDGEPAKWFPEMFTNLLIDAELLYHPLTEERRSLYSLRHAYATIQILERGTGFELLAKQMGTSVQMIEQHYSHLTALLKADEILVKHSRQ